MNNSSKRRRCQTPLIPKQQNRIKELRLFDVFKEVRGCEFLDVFALLMLKVVCTGTRKWAVALLDEEDRAFGNLAQESWLISNILIQSHHHHHNVGDGGRLISSCPFLNYPMLTRLGMKWSMIRAQSCNAWLLPMAYAPPGVFKTPQEELIVTTPLSPTDAFYFNLFAPVLRQLAKTKEITFIRCPPRMASYIPADLQSEFITMMKENMLRAFKKSTSMCLPGVVAINAMYDEPTAEAARERVLSRLRVIHADELLSSDNILVGLEILMEFIVNHEMNENMNGYGACTRRFMHSITNQFVDLILEYKLK